VLELQPGQALRLAAVSAGVQVRPVHASPLGHRLTERVEILAGKAAPERRSDDRVLDLAVLAIPAGKPLHETAIEPGRLAGFDGEERRAHVLP